MTGRDRTFVIGLWLALIGEIAFMHGADVAGPVLLLGGVVLAIAAWGRS